MLLDNLSSWRWFPLSSLVLALLTYGILANRLGFYWDDWAHIASIKVGNFWEFYSYDRPFSAWTFVVFAPIFGMKPVGWQFFTVFLRWLTTLGVWITLNQIWPNKKQETGWISFLFLTSPAFLQQFYSVTYTQHFLTYVFYFISTISMLFSFRSSRGKVFFSSLSFASELIHLLTMEYFWGLEFLRPYMIWKSLPDSLNKRARLLKTFLIWLPYLIIFILVIIWRFRFSSIDEGRNSLDLFSLFTSSPFTTILSFIMIVIRDLSYLLITAWYPTFQTSTMAIQPPGILFSWVLVIFISVTLWWIFRKEKSDTPDTWAYEAAWFGLYSITVGMLPGWAVARQITVGAYSDRIALPALLGTGILIVALIRIIIKERSVQVLFLSLLIGISIGYHFRIANNYRWYWEKQRDFFWQYYWRVPSLEPNTGIIADGALLPRVSGYSMSSAINVLNAPFSLEDRQPYWFFELDRNFTYDLKALFANHPIEGNLRNFYFEGRGNDVIQVSYDETRCLWLLDETDKLNPALSSLAVRGLPVSNPSRVISNPEPDSAILTTIFGDEPEHGWCYYYEKANIAFYDEEWQKVNDYYNEATAKGYKTKIGFELKPFVIANTKLGKWEFARDLTITAYERDITSKRFYCDLWESLLKNVNYSDASNEAFANVYDSLKCKKP